MTVSQAACSRRISLVLDYLSLQKHLCFIKKPLSEKPNNSFKVQKISSKDSWAQGQDLNTYFLKRFDEIFLNELNNRFTEDYVKNINDLQNKQDNLKWPSQNILATYYSHSAFQTLIKTQVKVGNVPHKILGSYNACQWIKDNTKNYDAITQREVIRTGLVGRCSQFGPTDIYENNQLTDQYVYLFAEPEKCGEIIFYSDEEGDYINTIYQINSNKDHKLLEQEKYMNVLSDLSEKQLISNDTKEEILKSLNIQDNPTDHLKKDFELYFEINFNINGISRIEII